MRLTSDAVSALVSQLEKEFRSIEENWDLNTVAWERIEHGADHPLDWAALGYTLHAAYTAMENYFLRVVKAFENDVPRESWHREVLDRMQLEVSGVRPALLDRDSTRLIDELRAFRHVFRSLYDERLDPERLALLQRRAPTARAAFARAHEAFLPKVVALIEEQ